MIAMLRALVLGVGLLVSPAAHAALLFQLVEVDGGVEMRGSGSIDLNGLVDTGDGFFWGGVAIQRDVYAVFGSTTRGPITSTYRFNDGTDFSEWLSPNVTTSGVFGWDFASDLNSFATYTDLPSRQPGLGIVDTAVVGSVWTLSSRWFEGGATFSSLGLNVGTYTVTDSVSGETMVIQIGDLAPVPLPAPIMLLLTGLIGLAYLGRRRSS